jgi:hypothetical protein
MMDILSENSKKVYPNSGTEILEEKRFVQGVSYFINKNSCIYLKIQLDE